MEEAVILGVVPCAAFGFITGLDAGLVTRGLNVDLPTVPRTAFTEDLPVAPVEDLDTAGFVPDFPTTCAASTVPKL